MWIFSKLGFFSAVESPLVPENVIVRSRLPGDLDRLLQAMTPEEHRLCGEPKIFITPDADYRYRLELSKSVFAELVRRQAEDIDYDSLENAVRGGNPIRDTAYMNVWRAMWAAQNFGENQNKVR